MSNEFVMVPRGLLERALDEAVSDWIRIDNEWGPCDGGLDGAISRGEGGVIPELREILDKPAMHQGEPVALPARKGTHLRYDTLMPTFSKGWNACLYEIAKLGPLFTRTDPGEVERLRTELEGYKQGSRIEAEEADSLRAQLVERDTDLEFWKKSCRTWEAVAKKQNDRLFDVLQAILNGSKLSYHPWPVDGAEFEPLEASNPVYLVGGKDGAIAIRPYAEPVFASAEPSAPAERICTHPKGCTQCSWCGFKSEHGVEIQGGVFSLAELSKITAVTVPKAERDEPSAPVEIDERAELEAYCAKVGLPLDRLPSGEYLIPATRFISQGWHAHARAALERKP